MFTHQGNISVASEKCINELIFISEQYHYRNFTVITRS
jgi:hypothetical protein